MRENKKLILKYVGLFLFFFFSLVFFFNLSRGDTYVNFGFSYAIARGEVPYLDFNMVIPPLSPWFYSIFLLFSKSILIYYAVQALLLTILFSFLFKLLGKKAWVYLILIFMPFPISMNTILFPGYNFLLLFLLVIVIYCEKEKKSDYLIGFLLGLLFLTKQTVGGLLFLASFYYLFKDYKKVLKRIVGFLVPTIFTFLVLLIEGCFKEFVDLCFLGLLDFGNSNFNFDLFYLIVFVLGLVVLIVRIIRKPKDISNYYVLLFASCVFPIIDYYHVSLFLGSLFLLILLDLPDIKQNIAVHCVLLASTFAVLWFVFSFLVFKDIKLVNYHNFELSLVSKNYDNSVRKLDQYLEVLDKNIIYLLKGSENYFFKIKSNLDITYFDLPNYGNYGYNGTDKLINKLKQVKDSYIVIDRSIFNDENAFQQYIKEASEYVIKCGKLVKKIGVYEIYEM